VTCQPSSDLSTPGASHGLTWGSILELLATYPDRAAILAEYPFLEAEDFQQALRYASIVS
jgi:uncharacterized protein (DUF433 family)